MSHQSLSFFSDFAYPLSQLLLRLMNTIRNRSFVGEQVSSCLHFILLTVSQISHAPVWSGEVFAYVYVQTINANDRTKDSHF